MFKTENNARENIGQSSYLHRSVYFFYQVSKRREKSASIKHTGQRSSGRRMADIHRMDNGFCLLGFVIWFTTGIQRSKKIVLKPRI